jgi:hypothetical protein
MTVGVEVYLKLFNKMKEHFMKRYERVRLHKGGDHAVEMKEFMKQEVKDRLEQQHIDGVLESLDSNNTSFNTIITHYFWSIIGYVHYEMVAIEKKQVVQALNVAVQTTLTFLYGKWRTCYSWNNIICDFPEGPPYLTVDETRQKIGWVYDFRDGLLAALLLDDRDSAQKMLDWIQIDACRDKNRSAQTDPSDVEYLMLLGHFFRTGYLDNVDSLKEAVRKGRCKRTQMLLDCLERIVTKDVKKFVTLFEKYLKHAFKSNLMFSHPDSPRSPAALTDIDACIIWTVALRSGLTLPELSDELMDYVIRPQTLGLRTVSGQAQIIIH